MGLSWHSVRSLWQKGCLWLPAEGRRQIYSSDPANLPRGWKKGSLGAANQYLRQAKFNSQAQSWVRPNNLVMYIWTTFALGMTLDRSLKRIQAIFNISISSSPTQPPWQTFLCLHSNILVTIFTNKRKLISFTKKRKFNSSISLCSFPSRYALHVKRNRVLIRYL